MSDHDPYAFDNSKWANKRSNLKQADRSNADSQERRTAADAGHPEADVYYRKMSNAEYVAMGTVNRYNMAAALKYVDTKNYRYWLSTSLVKVTQFENEKAIDDAVIVKLTFISGFSKTIQQQLKPHQMRGVQHDNAVVAYHRERFLERGNIETMVAMNALLAQNKHHNVGFTTEQAPLLQANIKLVDKIS